MTRRIPAEVFPPGEFIREELDERGWTQGDLAEILGRPIRLVNEILSGKRTITPETARGLGEAFGTSAEIWLNLESQYQLSKIQETGGDVTRRARLYSIAPVKDMIRRQWIKETKSPDELEKELIDFFDGLSAEEINLLGPQAAARKSGNYDTTTPAEHAWLQRVRRIAATFEVSPYKKERLDRLSAELKRLLANAQDAARVPKFLADHGIRFLVVEHLPKTRFDGVALWLDEEKPVIAVTLRLDRVDSFWFTLIHELGHIAYGHHQHGHHQGIDSDLAGDDPTGPDEVSEQERLANSFAREFLVPSHELDTFAQAVRPFFSRIKINQFAAKLRVHPGIVLGQLQKREEVNYSHCREMLEKVREIVIREATTDGWGHLPGIKS